MNKTFISVLKINKKFHYTTNIIFIVFILISLSRVPYTGSFIDSYLFDFVYGSFKYIIYAILLFISLSCLIELDFFGKILKWRYIIGFLLLFCSLGMVFTSFFEKHETLLKIINSYMDNFKSYSEKYTDYSLFINPKISSGIVQEFFFAVWKQGSNFIYILIAIPVIIFSLSLFLNKKISIFNAILKKMFPDLYIHKGKTKITISEKKINKCDLLSLENDAKKKLNSFPSFDYLCDTGEDYDINNLKYFEKIIEKIEAVFAKNQIQVLSKKISTMPVFTKIEFFVNESQVEQVLKLQQILYKVLDIGKFIIMAKDNSIRFEIINVKYGKISFKYLVSNCKNADHLPIGIDIEKNIIFFNTEKNKIITIYGKMGSGTNMAIFSLVLSFCYFNNPLDSTVKIINNSSRDNLHIFDTLSKTVHVNHDCLTDSEEISDYFTNLISTKQIKKTLIVFENFDKYISSSSKNRSSFIEFLKAIKSSSNIYLILTCYEVSVDSAGDDIFNLMENKLVYKLNNETESVSLLKTPIANLLYGNGDGYILDESNVKNRIQTCYIGRNEINNIIDIINTFYLAVNKIN